MGPCDAVAVPTDKGGGAFEMTTTTIHLPNGPGESLIALGDENMPGYSGEETAEVHAKDRTILRGTKVMAEGGTWHRCPGTLVSLCRCGCCSPLCIALDESSGELTVEVPTTGVRGR